MALRVSKISFNEDVINADKPVLVEFYSDTCIPCKKLAGILGDIEDEYENKIYIRKVNVNYEESLVEEYKIMSSPTTLLFNEGNEISRVTGAVEKDKLIELFIQVI